MVQLKESLTKSRGMLLNEKLDAKTRERWTQVHTNTAQVLNQVLRDRQFKDWEKRLGELEARGRRLRGSIGKLESSRTINEQENMGQSAATKQDKRQAGGS